MSGELATACACMPSSQGSPGACRWRAAARPIRLATEPPEVISPYADFSNPNSDLNQPITACSTALAEGESFQMVQFWLSIAASASARMAVTVGVQLI